MPLILLLVFSLVPNLSHAGATYRYCGNKEIPNVKVCEDQMGVYIQDGDGPILEFQFTGYGENRSIQFHSTANGEFRLVTEWGASMQLIDSQEASYELLCDGDVKHGLCPR